MLDFLKNYYVFMLVLMVFSYLVPKEDYKVYIQFFISIFIIVLLLRPVMKIFNMDVTEHFFDIFETIRLQMESLDREVMIEEDIYEYFFSERDGQ